MLRVSGKVAGCEMAERWFPGVWLGTQGSSGEHLVARTSDGLDVQTRAVKEMLAIIDDLNTISGKPWAPTGVLTEKSLCTLSRQ